MNARLRVTASFHMIGRRRFALGIDLSLAYQSLGYFGAFNVACAMKVPRTEFVDLEFRDQKEMARCKGIPIK